ncbi:hypothetical protein [Devosia nitrariae]|uniref:Uncharacterized protein n=1 Tax=Devosia nitrariae TaxID=2071872 RepID=A0ABQ5W3B7_9HYPH|nr:hypothetical protein [Devosia nitrariae]GLQ54553.1 hypothetical protein GCM10010862_18120 [Devosia nitrariae]
MRQSCAAVILAALSFPCAAEELTPQAIRAMIADVGADAAVQWLDEGNSPGNAWAQLTDKIESGEAAWLDLVPLLKPGTDAGTAEDLEIALSRALRANPQGVLALVAAGHYAPVEICTGNEIENPPLEAVAGIDAALKTVAALLDPALREGRNACLAELGKARIAILVGAANPLD